MLLDRAGQFDEGLELLRRAAVVAEPILSETQQFPDARGVGKLIAQLAQRSGGSPVALVIEVLSSLEEAGEKPVASTPGPPEDLSLDLLRDSPPTMTALSR
ncbi:MAG TPA: hypothetical protein VG869_04410 [Acidimicrobiia bacterium]|nr:hypothetical protein [Acidimicrobiia bacterium]